RRKTCLVRQITFRALPGIRRADLDVFRRNCSAVVRHAAHTVIQLPLRRTWDEIAAEVDESKSRTITAKKWISLPDRGLVFTIMAAARANIGWISCSLSLATQFQATGMMTSVYSLLPGGSTAQTLNVTGRKLISADTTFTIADFATAKGSGGYGNCRASQA